MRNALRAKVIHAASAALLAVTCAPPAPPSPPRKIAPLPPAEPPGLHFDIGAIDPHAQACVDFYDYACGGWRKAHPIPPDQPRWSRYAELVAVNLDKERAIVEDSARGGQSASPAERRVGAYYAACMDQATIEARGLAPIREILGRIGAIRTARDASAVIGDLHAHDLDAMFSRYIEPDPNDAKTLVVWLDRGSLGLPDPIDYEKTDEASVALRGHYLEHLARLFSLLGATDEEAKASAARTVAFESSLAAKALSAVDQRNHDLQKHPMTPSELSAKFPAIDWKGYFAALGGAAVDRVNVAQPAWFDALNAALSAPDLAGARAYLTVLALRTAATTLPKAIDDEVFDFRQRRVRGAKEMPPRWKRCLKLVDGDIGDDVGRIFVARHFKADARAKMQKMIEALVSAYRADIASADWLGPSARAAATAKLATSLIVVGASNRPRSFDGLQVEKDDAFGNAWRAQALYVAFDMGHLGKPTDREQFFAALPQQLDGFGSKSKNATGFTAGFLQPPVFDPRMDDAVNFGGLGSVIGHELSHQFDDEGRKFDAEGNLRSWWSAEDVERFKERAQCFIDEYGRFRIDDGTPVDGRLTLGENIADNGGIRLSYAALRPSDTGPKIDGFTPAQRFFLAWAQIRCENVTPEAAHRQVASDPHAPGRFRVNGVVSNMPEFAGAFGCSAGAPMAPEKRCTLW